MLHRLVLKIGISNDISTCSNCIKRLAEHDLYTV